MIFKNKTNQPQVTLQNMKLNRIHIKTFIDDGLSNLYALKLAEFRQIDTKILTSDEMKFYKSQYREAHKKLAKQIKHEADHYIYDVPKYYHRKKMIKLLQELNNSKFKDELQKEMSHYDVEDFYNSDHATINKTINQHARMNDNHKYISDNYLGANHDLLWKILEIVSLSKISSYPDKGKYQIKLGSLKFSDNFNIISRSDYNINITLPHSYKTEVLGSGLEVIDNKYLTITLTPYDSIIKDCQMYQAELLKVKKIFKDSEIEQAYLAKLDNQVVIAKTHEQLMRKVIKVKEAVRDSKARQAA